MSEPETPQEPCEVSDSWQQMVQAVLALVLLLGAVAMFHYYAPVTAQSAQPDEMHQQVQQKLSLGLFHTKAERAT